MKKLISLLFLLTASAFACNYPWEYNDCVFVSIADQYGFWSCDCRPYYGANPISQTPIKKQSTLTPVLPIESMTPEEAERQQSKLDPKKLKPATASLTPTISR